MLRGVGAVAGEWLRGIDKAGAAFDAGVNYFVARFPGMDVSLVRWAKNGDGRKLERAGDVHERGIVGNEEIQALHDGGGIENTFRLDRRDKISGFFKNDSIGSGILRAAEEEH